MNQHNKVIWHEGLFLQPQHLQQHDRFVEHLIDAKHTLLNKNLWGFTELKLDLSLLSVGKLGIASARGIFEDGTLFDIPNIDQSPTPYVIEEGLKNTTLYLALPLKQAGNVEVATPESERVHRYDIINRNVVDHVADSQFESTLQLGSLACQILSEHDDLSAYTVLPITRISETRANHQITLDETFMTTWLNVHQCASIKQFITEVHDLLSHRAEMLAGRLMDTQQASTAEIADFILLQLANRYEPLFHHYMHQNPLHPETLFKTLIQLLGEMSTYTNNQRRADEPPVYQHKNLFKTFQPIVTQLRHALSMVLEQNATAIALEERGHGLWVGQIHDKALIHSAQFVLAVYADLPLEHIRDNFGNQIKIAPVEHIRTLVSKALPGIPVNHIAVAPRQIPYHANFAYFAIATGHELWQMLDKSGGLALHVGGQLPGLKLQLWAIKG